MIGEGRRNSRRLRYPRPAIPAVMILFVTLFGCSLLTLPDSGSPEATEAATETEMTDPTPGATPTEGVPSDGILQEGDGGIDLWVPLVSPSVLSALGATYDPGYTADDEAGAISGSAMMFATSVDITLFQGTKPEGELRGEWSLTAEQMTSSIANGVPGASATLEFDAGENYYLEVAVNNSKVETTPVVTGTSDYFSVSEGVFTSVVITCVPTNDAVLPLDAENSYHEISVDQSTYEFGTEEGDIVISEFGGEAWFKLSHTGSVGDYGRILIDPGGEMSCDTALFQWDENGAPIDLETREPEVYTSWGFFPTELGGYGGTRLGVMGPLEEAENDFYFGLALMSRYDDNSAANVEVRFDVLTRTWPGEPGERPYPNAFLPTEDPISEDVYPLPPDWSLLMNDEMQTVFFSEEDLPYVHYFSCENIAWGTPGTDIEITVTATFEVLATAHLEGDDDGVPMLAVAAGVLGEDNPTFYHPMEDPGLTVTDNGGEVWSTTIEFTASIPLESNDYATILVSSPFEGNAFDLQWNAPSGIELVVE